MKQPTAMDQRTAMAASRCRACSGNGCSFCFGKLKDEVLAEQRDRIAELERWIDDCLQFLTGDDDMCAALNHLERAAQPQLEALLAGGEELISEGE